MASLAAIGSGSAAGAGLDLGPASLPSVAGAVAALTPEQRDAVFDICSELLWARSDRYLHACLNGPLRRLLGYESFVYGFGRASGDELKPLMLISHDFPQRYLDSITQHGRMKPQTLQLWHHLRQPLAMSFDDEMVARLPATMGRAVRNFGFHNLLCHGQVDLDARHMSYITFNGIPNPITLLQRTIAAHVMPHLHASILRIFQDMPQPVRTAAMMQDAQVIELSERQQQILYLLALGKTNWEISQILKTSVDNVKYHLKRLNAMFDTSSRAAIVAEASRLGSMPKVWPEGSRRPV